MMQYGRERGWESERVGEEERGRESESCEREIEGARERERF